MIRPGAIALPCGVGFVSENGVRLLGLAWTSWRPTSATGHGTYKVDTCTPNCALGSYVSYPVSLELTTPTQVDGFNVFSVLKIHFTLTPPVSTNSPNAFGATELDLLDYSWPLPGTCPSQNGQTAGGC